MLHELQMQRVRVPVGKEIVLEGEKHHSSYVLQEGWACSYKRLRDGSRQIINIQIPGDFVGLRSLLLRASDHTCVMLTNVELSKITTDRLGVVVRETPRLARALLWAASRDEAMMVEQLVGNCRRAAYERTVHFLLELGARLHLIGIGSGDRYDCPLSQSILADTLAVTAIHLNRVLRQLREAKVVFFRDGIVIFPDITRAAELTGYDLGYLEKDHPSWD